MGKSKCKSKGKHHHHSKKKSKSKSKSRHKSGSKGKSKDKSGGKGGKNKSQVFKMKGKAPPAPKGQLLNETPSQMTPDQMTTIYHIPTDTLKTPEDVVKYNGYEMETTELGKGGFATIYKGKNVKTGKPCAVKVVELNDQKERMREMKNELFIMEMMESPYAVRVYLHFLINTKLYIFMQLADKGSFAKFLETNGVLNENDCKQFFAQMCCGVQAMHDKGIVHRDIKPANFLMAESHGTTIVLVSDFGLSRLAHCQEDGKVGMNTTQCGTPAYMSPEILLRQPYHPLLVDVWSLGVTLYAMLHLMTPFDVNQDDYGVKDMNNKKWSFSEQAMKGKPSEPLKKAMACMLEPDPKKRITLKALIQHEWLKDEYEKAKKLKD